MNELAATIDRPAGTWERVGINLVEGSNTITAVARDAASNTTTERITVRRLEGADCDPLADFDSDGIDDCSEIREHRTSPYDADTDGDGLSDSRDLGVLGFDPMNDRFKFNPLVADVPKIAFELTTFPSISLLGTTTTGETQTWDSKVGSEEGETFTQSRTDTRAHSVEMSTTDKFGIEQEFSLFPPSFGGTKASYERTVSNTTTDETSVSFSRISSQSFKTFSEESVGEAVSTSVSLDGGAIAVTARIKNVGNLSFMLASSSLAALQWDQEERNSFSALMNLEVDTRFNMFPRRTLRPNDTL